MSLFKNCLPACLVSMLSTGLVNAQSYPAVSFIDLAVGRVKLQPGQRVEMTGYIEADANGMVFLYSYGQSKIVSSSAARMTRQIVVTGLPTEVRVDLIERCGGNAECPATVHGVAHPEGGTAIVAKEILFNR